MNLRHVLAMGVAGMVAWAGVAQAGQAVSLSGRYHQDQEEFTEYPFNTGDLSYMVAWETDNDDALVQFGAAFCPSFKERETLDYAVTPQMNLLLKDRVFRGGLGILTTYTQGDEDDDWTDMYWQFLLGLSFGVTKKVTLDTYAVYPFKDWDSLGDFKGEAIEYTAGLAWHF